MSDFLLPEISNWSEWASIFTDVDLWTPVVERVWRENEAFGQVMGRHSAMKITAGYPGTCAVFVIDDAVVIKFFPPMVTHDFTREIAAYELISQHVPHIPMLLGKGVFVDRHPWPYLVIERIPGKAWRDLRSSLTRPVALMAMSTLGSVIRSTHEMPLPQSGAWPAVKNWAAFVESRLSHAGAEITRGTALRQELSEGIEAFLAATDWFADRPCLVHGDLTEDHLLLDRRDGDWKMTGLIDWADAEVAAPQYDWVALWFSICHRDADLFRAFMNGYNGEGNRNVSEIQSIPAYTFLHRFAANIINDALSDSEQRAVRSLAELQSLLFGGLDGSID